MHPNSEDFFQQRFYYLIPIPLIEMVHCIQNFLVESIDRFYHQLCHVLKQFLYEQAKYYSDLIDLEKKVLVFLDLLLKYVHRWLLHQHHQNY